MVVLHLALTERLYIIVICHISRNSFDGNLPCEQSAIYISDCREYFSLNLTNIFLLIFIL